MLRIQKGVTKSCRWVVVLLLLIVLYQPAGSLWCAADLPLVTTQGRVVLVRSAPSLGAPIRYWLEPGLTYRPECVVLARRFVFYAVRLKGVRVWIQQAETYAVPG